jgi:hypothetical protein
MFTLFTKITKFTRNRRPLSIFRISVVWFLKYAEITPPKSEIIGIGLKNALLRKLLTFASWKTHHIHRPTCILPKSA